jgi:asparagine synthase (glutamine-hydrolysing)
MSGIVGIYHLDGQPVDSEQLTRMVDVLAHRGPDGSNIWCSESVGLGHRMLWTTPESLLEEQPLVDQIGDLVLISDLRIDNREELISALPCDGLASEKITDSQLVLAAYRKWGEQCPEKLLGDFAFAIWDKRKQVLFCARDHFGIKPLYYFYRPSKHFYFASEIKALLCLPQVPTRLNEVAIANHLHPFTQDKSITVYQDIFRLPPGHSLTVSYKTGLKTSSYWTLAVGDELKLSSDAEYAEAFREIFTEAVRCRLRSAFPVSCHLSGGLDSSSIACVARNILQQEKGSQLHTLSNIFDAVPECDERPYINAVLEQGGFIPHYVNADQSGPISEWQQYFQYIDEPLIGPSHYLVWGLNRATQQASIRIALDGFDGDTTVSHGAVYFAELARQGKWSTFLVEAQAVSQHFNTSVVAILSEYGLTYLEELAKQRKWGKFIQTANQISKYFRVSRQKLFVSYGLKNLVPRYILQMWRSLRGYNHHQNDPHPLINPNLANRLGVNHSHQSPNNTQMPAITVREDQWQSLTSPLFTTVLELVDQCASAFSMELRHPFMDKRLIEFCLSLPPEQKLNQGWSRMVMRRAMTDILPEQVQWRGGKADMTANFQRGVRHFDHQLMNEMIMDDPSRIQEFVNLNSLQEFYNQLMYKTEVTNEAAIIPVWKSVVLALWLSHTQIQP